MLRLIISIACHTCTAREPDDHIQDKGSSTTPSDRIRRMPADLRIPARSQVSAHGRTREDIGRKTTALVTFCVSQRNLRIVPAPRSAHDSAE